MKSKKSSDLVQMLKETTLKWGHNSKETAAVLVALGKAYVELDDVQNAEEHLKRAEKIFYAAGEDGYVRETRKILADLRNRVGTNTLDEEALKMSYDSVPIFEHKQKINDPVEQAKALLSEFSTTESNSLEAPPAAKQSKPAVQTESKIPQSITEETKESAGADQKLADYGPITSAIERANLEIIQMRRKGSEKTSQLADLLVEVASLYSKKNEPEMMENLLTEALQIRESIYGENHISVSKDLKNLGRMYLATRDYEKAETHIKRALEIREAILGPYHPHVADIAELYAKILRKTDKLEKAQRFEETVKESRTRHPSDWEAYKKAATKAMEEENYFLAQALWLAAQDEADSFEEEDPRILTTLEGLAHVFWKRSRYDKAEPLCRQILQVSERILGKDHLDVAFAVKNLALVNERLGKHTDASVLYQEAVRIMELCLGVDHPDVKDLIKSKKEALDKAHEELAQKIQKSF